MICNNCLESTGNTIIMNKCNCLYSKFSNLLNKEIVIHNADKYICPKCNYEQYYYEAIKRFEKEEKKEINKLIKNQKFYDKKEIVDYLLSNGYNKTIIDKILKNNCFYIFKNHKKYYLQNSFVVLVKFNLINMKLKWITDNIDFNTNVCNKASDLILNNKIKDIQNIDFLDNGNHIIIESINTKIEIYENENKVHTLIKEKEIDWD